MGARYLALGLWAVAGLWGFAPQSHAGLEADGSYSVRIYHGYEYGTNPVLRIYASINGGTMVPFLLDTGSPNLFATYGSWWPGSPTQVEIGQYRDKFSSGNEFYYNDTTARVTFGDRNQNSVVSVTGVVAQMTLADVNGNVSDYDNWKHVDPATQTALPNGTFGNMGFGLEGNGNVPGLATLAAQIPLRAGMQSGFVINTGGSQTSRARLVLGLSPGVMANFLSSQALVLKMAPTGGTIPGPNGTTVPGYQEAQAGYTTVTVTYLGQKYTGALPTIFDSGGGKNTYINAFGSFLAAISSSTYYPDEIEVTSGLQQIFNYLRHTPLGGGLSVDPTAGGSDPRTNTGLSIFMQYLVLFNLTGGWMSLLPFGALDELPFLSNDFTPENANFIVNGDVTASQGPVTVNSLTFTPDSLLDIPNRVTVTSGALDVPSGRASVSGGELWVPGDLTKSGAGTLLTDSAIVVNGVVQVAAGGLVVNQTLQAAGGLSIYPDAWLGGSGLIDANVLNNGTVSPGNSPGTLTVLGNFTQTNNGTLTIEVQSASVYDRLLVAGTANLAGTLNVLPYESTFFYGQTVPGFLQAGAITGEFDQVILPEGFRGRVLQNWGTLNLLIAPSSYTLMAQTANQLNVAQALDAFIPATSGDRLTISTALDSLSAEAYPGAFDQISPAFYETLTDATIEQYVTQGQMLIQRLSSVQFGERAFQQIGMNFSELSGDGQTSAKEAKSMFVDPVEFAWSSWISGNGIFANNYNVANLPGYRSASGGVMVGADRKWDHGLTTGVYAGYQGSYSDYANDSLTQMNGARFGVYAAWQPAASGFYANTAVGGGVSSYSIKRSIEFANVSRTAESDPAGGEFATWLNLGYDWKRGGFAFGPVADLQFTYAGISPFTETGAESLNLRVGQQNATSLRSTFGGRIAYTARVAENLLLIPEFRMGWQHEFLQNPTSINAALDGGSGAPFDYTTSAPARDAAWAGVGLTLQIGERWNANVWYNSSFGRNDYTSQSISGGLGIRF